LYRSPRRLGRKEALRYRTALREAFEKIKSRPSNTVLSEQICSTLRGVHMTIRKVTGTTLSNQMTREIIYTPPVIKMAVGHYQFEAITSFY
jgi:hypothetical protein